MRNRMDSNQACSGLIDSYIGTAYDVVKEVYDNLDAIKYIGSALSEEDFQTLLENADTLDDLAAAIDDFNNRYYGPLDEEPTTKPNGDPIDPGDMYYNTVTTAMYYYKEDKWVTIGDELNAIDIFTITADQVSAPIVLELSQPYTPGANQLSTYVNAGYQFSTANGRANGGYNETNPNEITFPQGYLEEGDIIAVISGDTVSAGDVSVSVDIETYLTTIEGEKYIVLPGGLSYEPGTDNLEVYVDGARKAKDIDYVETSSTEVTFVNGLPISSLVLFVVGEISGTTGGSNNLTQQFQVLNSMAEFNILDPSLNENLAIFLKGYALPGDGGGGDFVYDTLYPRVKANGGTVVDSTVTLPLQGAGIGNGCWVRQYETTVSSLWFGETYTFASALNKYGTLREGDLVLLDGYQALGDHGEGYFYWDSEKPKTAHDGGAVIDPVKVFPPNWGDPNEMLVWFTPKVSGFGCWVRQDSTAANIGWFGGIGDGVTDNRASFQAAAISAANGIIPRLAIPAGDYTLNNVQPVTIESVHPLFEVYGEGAASIISYSELAPIHAIEITASDGIHFKDIKFVDKRVAKVFNSLSISNSKDILISRCYFEDFGGSAIRLTERTDPISTTACDYFRVRNCFFKTCGTDTAPTLLIEPKTKSKGLVIEDNWFESCGSATVPVIRAGTATTGAVIRNNSIDSAPSTGIEVAAYEDVSVIGNYINDFVESGVLLIADNLPNYLSPSCDLADIRENRFYLSTDDQTIYAVETGGSLLPDSIVLLKDNMFINCNSMACTAGSVCTSVDQVNNFKKP